MTFRIEAPYFVAGGRVGQGEYGIATITQAAPIIQYMEGWTLQQARNYCAGKQWKFQELGHG